MLIFNFFFSSSQLRKCSLSPYIVGTDKSIFFGGNVNEINIGGVIYNQYNLNITNHLNNLLNNSLSETKLVISSFGAQRHARRSVAYGPESLIQPARLKLIITKP